MWRARLLRAWKENSGASLQRAWARSPYAPSAFQTAPAKVAGQPGVPLLRNKPNVQAWLGRGESSFVSGNVASWKRTEMYGTEAFRESISEWARLVHQQALSSRYLWPVSYSKWNVRKVFWPAEQWLLVSSVIRNSSSCIPDFAQSLVRGRWTSVATMTSLNTVGVHVPRMLGLLIAKCIRNVSSAEALSREAFYPLKDVQLLQLCQQPGALANLIIQASSMFWSIVRLLWLCMIFSPLIVSWPIAVRSGLFTDWWMCQLRRTLEISGPAFIKWGQWAATRKDIFPPLFCSELQKLQTMAPMHSFSATEVAIARAFGMPVSNLFSEFDKTPIASGSIGQVHRAVLNRAGSAITGVPEGTEVAVKVRHPYVDEIFKRDHSLMLNLVKLLCVIPAFNELQLEDTIHQFSGPMMEQVNLCAEAANLRIFNQNFQNDPNVVFPEPLFPLVSQDVLVETFHKGKTVHELCETESETERGHKLSALGTSTFFKMLLDHNLLHADLHPGNILVEFESKSSGPSSWARKLSERLKNEGTNSMLRDTWFELILDKLAAAGSDSDEQPSQPKIVLLDAGMAAQLNEREQACMLEMFKGLSRSDGIAVANATLGFSGRNQTCPNRAGYQQSMIEHFEAIHRGDSWSDSGYENGVEALSHCLDMIRQYRVVLPGQVCSVLFTVFVLEGWSSSLDNEHGVMDKIKDLTQGWGGNPKLQVAPNKIGSAHQTKTNSDLIWELTSP